MKLSKSEQWWPSRWSFSGVQVLTGGTCQSVVRRGEGHRLPGGSRRLHQGHAAGELDS